MKAPDDWPPPPPDPWLDGEISEKEISDTDVRDTLDTFLMWSLKKGYVYLDMDFEHLMQSVQRAISWYDTLHDRGDELDYD